MTLYFGDPWPSVLCEEGVQVPTPVGEPCFQCDETIVDGDQGVLRGGVLADPIRPTTLAAHKECDLRSVLGGWGHLTMKCSCYGGDSDPDDGLTVRESALRVWAWVHEHGTPTR